MIYPDSNGNPWGIVSAEQLWANVYAIKYNKPENRLDQKIWLNLLKDAKKAAIDFGAISLQCRIRLDYEPDLFRNLFKNLGFNKKSRRIEYQQLVDKLPNENGTPFIWKTALELNWNPQQIAKFTEQVRQDALDVEPNENAEDFIQDCLHNDELTSGPECVAVGFLQNQPCALTIVQINKESGWSRISYMGLIPSHRGKALGKWVHRHGFVMMKMQGGKLYHGGTLSNNLAMRKLFEVHNCQIFCEMEEWFCNLNGGFDETTSC